MRNKLIQTILETLQPYNPEQMEHILKGYNDSDLIAFGLSLGIDTDSLFKEVA